MPGLQATLNHTRNHIFVQSIAPVASEQTVSTADKITAAIVVVALASTVGAGTVAVKKARDRDAREVAPVAAAPAPSDAAAPTLAPTPVEPKATKEQPKAAKEKDPIAGTASETVEPEGSVAPVAGGTEGPSASPSASPSPSDPPSTQAPTPTPPPPAPAWSGSFKPGVPFGDASLSLASARSGFVPSGDTLFSHTLKGTFSHRSVGDGSVYMEYWGSAGAAGGGWISMWLFVDTAQGRFRYEAAGTLESAVLAEDGSVTRIFTADYVLTEWPEEYDGLAMPHDGVATFTLRFWQDGTLYRSGIGLDERALVPADV